MIYCEKCGENVVGRAECPNCGPVNGISYVKQPADADKANQALTSADSQKSAILEVMERMAEELNQKFRSITQAGTSGGMVTTAGEFFRAGWLACRQHDLLVLELVEAIRKMKAAMWSENLDNENEAYEFASTALAKFEESK